MARPGELLSLPGTQELGRELLPVVEGLLGRRLVAGSLAKSAVSSQDGGQVRGGRPHQEVPHLALLDAPEKLHVVLLPLQRVREHAVGAADLLESLQVSRVPVRVVQLGQVVEGLLQRPRIHARAHSQYLIIIWFRGLCSGHFAPSTE